MAPESISFSFDERLKEIDMFFDGRDKVHETMPGAQADLHIAVGGVGVVDDEGGRHGAHEIEALLLVGDDDIPAVGGDGPRPGGGERWPVRGQCNARRTAET